MLSRLRRRLGLAARILESHWSQPATALFRVFEVEVVQDHLRASGRALDLGCGDGTLATILLERSGVAEWSGTDLDAREVQMARRIGPYRRLYASSGEASPQRPGSVGLVFSNSAIEHMEHLDRVVGEAARVLEPGGRFVFTVPSADFHRCLFWPKVLGLFGGALRRERYLAAFDRRLAVVSYLTSVEWRELLASKGLEIERIVPYLTPRVCGWWETLANLTGGLAYVLQRGRRTPREVQLSLGIAGKESRLLGALMFVGLLPLLLWTAIEPTPEDEDALFGGIYVECVKGADRSSADAAL